MAKHGFLLVGNIFSMDIPRQPMTALEVQLIFQLCGEMKAMEELQQTAGAFGEV